LGFSPKPQNPQKPPIFEVLSKTPKNPGFGDFGQNPQKPRFWRFWPKTQKTPKTPKMRVFEGPQKFPKIVKKRGSRCGWLSKGTAYSLKKILFFFSKST
jgi:hypothetical protein